jgi:hypothetical protein
VPEVEVAAVHGVALKTVRRWRLLYEQLGQPRGQTHLAARCPRCENGALDEPAYAELFGWYLGDGWLERRRRDVYALHVYNDATYRVLNEGIQTLMRRVKPHCRPHTRLLPGCVVTTVSWKHWPCLLPQHGPGRKHERKLSLEPWQQELLSEHPGPFLRGLFHSDGCRANNWATRMVAGERKRYDYPRWQFVNNSTDIRRFCCDALDALDIAWKQSNWKTISVSRREGVALLDRIVGPKA